MATCPRCKGHLTDDHHCPRPRLFVVTEVIAAGLAGAIAGFLLVFAFDPDGRQISEMEFFISIVLGAGIAVGINRAVRS